MNLLRNIKEYFNNNIRLIWLQLLVDRLSYYELMYPEDFKVVNKFIEPILEYGLKEQKRIIKCIF